MSADRPVITIKVLPKGDERRIAIPILEQSFEGWYQWHAKRTLKDIEEVRAAVSNNDVAGIAMLKMLDPTKGYVYYIAVSPNFRRMGVGGKLLEDSLQYFFDHGAFEVYAGISEDNVESKALFSSQGFGEVSFSELSTKFGRLHAITMYRKMVIVSGEVVYVKQLAKTLSESEQARS